MIFVNLDGRICIYSSCIFVDDGKGREGRGREG